MARLKVVFERFGRKLLPSFRHKVFALALVGVFVGLGAYLVYMSKAYSYLSDDPRVCINCHVMGPYYATWQHSSHAMRATCNDCHVPHNSIFSKYYFKASDGLRHSYVFTMRNLSVQECWPGRIFAPKRRKHAGTATEMCLMEAKTALAQRPTGLYHTQSPLSRSGLGPI